jgi:hypothetical protein
MNIPEYNHGCLYGKHYDLSREQFPNPESDYDIILFLNLGQEDENKRVVSSIEGIFCCNQVLEESNLRHILKREDMKAFEKKYNGVFIPFKK